MKRIEDLFDYRYARYENQDIEAIKSGSKVNVYSKSRDAYYTLSSASLEDKILWSNKSSRVTWLVPITMFISIFVSLATIAFALFTDGNVSFDFPWIPSLVVSVIGYTLLQAAFHEYCHVVFLRAFGRPYDKIGFKLQYGVLPTVYVRVNQVLMLPRPKRAAVHLAGLFGNAVTTATVSVLNSLFFNSSTLSIVILIYSMGILLNIAPLLDSDGYKFLITVLNLYEAKDIRVNFRIIRLARIASLTLVTVYMVALIVGLVIYFVLA